MSRKGIASKPSGPIQSGRAGSSPTGAGMLTRKKAGGHSGLTATGGLGHITNLKSSENQVGAKLVRKGKAPGVAASRPKAGTKQQHSLQGPMSKAFSGPDKGVALKNKGVMPTNKWSPK